MLYQLVSLAYGHCGITAVGLNGKYMSPRIESDKYTYPLDHAELPFKDMNADAAVCHGAKKGQSIFTVKGGDILDLSFRPECNPTTTEGATTESMQKGIMVDTKSGDWQGGPRHGGGSCEVSMAFVDNPKWSDFVVIKRWTGTCPDSTIQWKFDLPKDLPTGPAIMQWTWHSAWGRSEFYSQCWDVTIQGSTAGKGLSGDCVAYANTNPSNKIFFEQDESCPYCGTKKNLGKKANLNTDVFTIPTTLAATNTCTSGGLKQFGKTQGTAGSVSNGAAVPVTTVPVTTAPVATAPVTTVPKAQAPVVPAPATQAPYTGPKSRMARPKRKCSK